MIVADLGAGSGFMTMRLARLVSPGGMVYRRRKINVSQVIAGQMVGVRQTGDRI